MQIYKKYWSGIIVIKNPAIDVAGFAQKWLK